MEEIIAFLQRPASYPHRPASVEIIQTHISYVAIAPPYVYKLKKPVDLGFLDFSTLEKRRRFCEEEVRLNRRLCAETYEGVVPISRTEDGLAFGEGVETVDYVVKMKQLRSDYFLAELLMQGKVTHDHIDRIVGVLASFYTSQQPSETILAWGEIDHLKVSTDENFEQIQSFVDDLVPSQVFRTIRYYADRFYRKHVALFGRRVAQGRILDCHGDLHLEHVHLSPEGVCIYDCIEFNERFRYIDIANDVAFLAMDLEHKGFPRFSRYFCEQIASKLADPELLAMLPFYKCYRAVVRGKVAAMKSVEEEVETESRQRSRKEAGSYFRLALQYAVQGSRPAVVAVMGRAGTGKSTQARLLAESTGWPLLSSDVTRKRLAGVPMTERGSESQRKALYSESATARTYTTLFEKAKAFLENGESVIVDATFSRERHRTRLRDFLQNIDADLLFFEITASDEAVKKRLAGRDQASDVISDARLEDFHLLSRQYETPAESEAGSVFSISSENPVEETAFELLKLLVIASS